jgi:hypothetical protein
VPCGYEGVERVTGLDEEAVRVDSGSLFDRESEPEGLDSDSLLVGEDQFEGVCSGLLSVCGGESEDSICWIESWRMCGGGWYGKYEELIFSFVIRLTCFCSGYFGGLASFLGTEM